MTIEYRVIHDPEELKVIVELETIVWSMPASEAVPHNMLFALIHSGGVVIQADEDGKAVGFALAIVALRGKEPILWSHMAGVIPSHQSSGIGFALKQAQRVWALEHGFKVIAWTFDPLQRKNAKFNLHLLKGVTSSYHVNFYGEMMDGINKGMPSDRLEVDWNLEDEAVIAAANGAPSTPIGDDYPVEAFLLHSLPDGLPHVQLPSSLSEKRYYVEIPYHLAALKRDNIQLAKNWQIGLREAMGSAFAQGFEAVDFVNAGERCWYVLEKS
jgi:predicted GNAT superfamily acetyltransferase